MIYRIFISFTREDREIKDSLVTKLNELNNISPKLVVHIWELDTGSYGIWDIKCYEELHMSDFVISILSENVKENSLVYDEINEAKKLCDERSLEFMPVILCEQQNKDEFKKYTRINAVGKDINECFQLIYSKVEENVNEKLKQPLTSEACVRVRSKDNNQHFFGRKQELEEIKELFKDNNIIVLTGIGGIGKTELAKEFARRNKEDFRESYIISYSLPPHTDTSDESKTYDVKDLICSLQFEKTPDTKDRDELYQINLECLKSIDKKTLLIIDDYDIEIDQVKGLIDVLNSCSCRFMFTSRYETTTIAMKEIKPMDDENIIKLFRGYYNLNYGIETITKKEISDEEILVLAQAVDYHTLAVSLMARLLRTSRKVDVESLKNVFDVKSKVYHEISYKEDTIYNHFENVFNLSKLSDFKKQVLSILCRVCSYGIDFDSLDNILKIEEDKEKELKELVSSGFVKLENNTYSLHMVISELAYRKLNVDSNQECDLLDWIINKLNIDVNLNKEKQIQCLKYGIFYIDKRSQIKSESDNYMEKLLNIYHHVGYLFNNIGDYDHALEYYFKIIKNKQVLGINHLKIITAYSNIGFVYKAQGKYDEALKYYFKALEICEQVLGPNHPDAASSYNNIGLVYFNQAKYDEALNYYFKALEIREHVLGTNHPNTAGSYNNIGGVYNAKGNYDEALEYYVKALEIIKQVLGPNHPSIAISYNNIGSVYYKKGNYDKALKYYFKALKIGEQILGSNHLDTATTYNNIGESYYAKGNYDKALMNCLKALKLREQVLGSKHPSTATSYNNIGRVYDAQENYDEALKYYFKAKEIFEQLFGPKHPSTATTYNNIGAVYNALGNYDEAIEYYVKALEICEQVLGPNHSDTASLYNNIGLFYSNQRKYDKSLNYYFKALEIYKQALGLNHPSIATSYNNIGAVYDALGNYEEALKYYFKASAICERLLDPNHPSTATSYNNIGRAYYDQENYDEALKYYFKALEIREQVLGPNHPDTATSYNNIGVVYQVQGKYDEALKYYFKALEIREQVLGQNHINTATSYNSIGLIYENQRNYDEALNYYFKALEIYEQILGPNHQSTATSYNNIGRTYDAQENYDEALKYYFKALEIYEQMFGPNYPATITTHDNISLVYSKKKLKISDKNIS